MKKTLAVLTFLLAGICAMQAQDMSKNALGLRIGDDDDNGIGLEITYQRAITEDNRVELDFGWKTGDFVDFYKLTGLYHWVFGINKGLNWYVGPGASLAYATFEPEGVDSEFYFFVAGNIGIEYAFEIPLQLSFDLRPEIGFDDATDDLEIDWGLSARYQF